MNKAIERAIEFFTALDKGKHIHGVPAPTGIIAELVTHKAKIDGLKEWVKQQEGGKIAYWSDVLQKLEELTK